MPTPGAKLFLESYLSPCRIAINFKYEILPSRISIRIAIDSRQVAIASAVYNKIRFEYRITVRHSNVRDIGHLHFITKHFTSLLSALFITVDFGPLQTDFTR